MSTTGIGGAEDFNVLAGRQILPGFYARNSTRFRDVHRCVVQQQVALSQDILCAMDDSDHGMRGAGLESIVILGQAPESRGSKKRPE